MSDGGIQTETKAATRESLPGPALNEEQDMLDMIVNPAASSGRTYLEFHKKIFPLFKGTDCRIHYSTSDRSVGGLCQSGGSRRGWHHE